MPMKSLGPRLPIEYSISFIGSNANDKLYLDRLFLTPELLALGIVPEGTRYTAVANISLSEEPEEIHLLVKQWLERMLRAESQLAAGGECDVAA